MTLAAALTLAVVVGVTIAMARDVAPDFSMFVGLCILVVMGVVTPTDAVAGFASPALATIAVLFVVAAALRDTGALTLLSRLFFGTASTPKRALMRLLIPVAGLSGVMNNTPIVAMMIPVVREYARRVQQPASRFLMPLSFAAILGGTCTLIGTSANLVVSGQLEKAGLQPLGMFELTAVGVPLALVGIVYLTLFAHRILPVRQEARAAAHEASREYLAEVEVASDSPLINRSIEDAGLRHLPGLFLVEIRRASGRLVRPVGPHHKLRKGDHLVFTGLASTVGDLRSFPGLTPVDDAPPRRDDRPLFEVVISHNSPLIGRTVREAEFRRRFNAAILAVHRSGQRIALKIGDIRLEPGDTLMLAASPGFLRAWRDSNHFYLVSAVQAETPPNYRQARIALLTLVAMVAAPTLLGVPMLRAAMGAALVLILTGCTTPRNARQAISWNVLILIGSAFGVAGGLSSSGAATWLAGGLVSATEPLGGMTTLAVIYVITVVFSSFVSNAAAAALVFPLALTTAQAGGHDPRAFAVVVALGASAGFATPMAYANLLVYGPGGYRYLDFVRLGVPLNVLCFFVTLAIVPWVWSL